MAEQTTTDVQVEALQRQVQTSETARLAAEAKAKESEERALSAVNARVASDEAAIRNAITAAGVTADAAEARFAEAMKSDDPSAAARAQRELTEAITNKAQHESRLSNLETWKKREVARATREREKPVETQRAAGPVVYRPKTQAWLDKHNLNGQPDANGNYDAKFTKAFNAHMYAVNAKGIQEESPEYFEFLDRELGHGDGGAEVESPMSQASTTTEVDLSDSGRIVVREPNPTMQQAREQSAPSLAPTRSVPEVTRGSSVQGGKVKLTPNEVEAARISFPHLWNQPVDEQGVDGRTKALREYARNKADLISEGHLNG